MMPDFQFKGFEPDDHLSAEAEGVLERIQSWVPSNATICSMMESADEVYTCSMDVFLRRDSVHASVNDADPYEALRRVEETIIEKLKRRQETRFFTRSDPSGSWRVLKTAHA